MEINRGILSAEGDGASCVSSPVEGGREEEPEEEEATEAKLHSADGDEWGRAALEWGEAEEAVDARAGEEEEEQRLHSSLEALLLHAPQPRGYGGGVGGGRAPPSAPASRPLPLPLAALTRWQSGQQRSRPGLLPLLVSVFSHATSSLCPAVLPRFRPHVPCSGGRARRGGRGPPTSASCSPAMRGRRRAVRAKWRSAVAPPPPTPGRGLHCAGRRVRGELRRRCLRALLRHRRPLSSTAPQVHTQPQPPLMATSAMKNFMRDHRVEPCQRCGHPRSQPHSLTLTHTLTRTLTRTRTHSAGTSTL